jgi:hypothetical protein
MHVWFLIYLIVLCEAAAHHFIHQIIQHLSLFFRVTEKVINKLSKWKMQLILSLFIIIVHRELLLIVEEANKLIKSDGFK